MAADDREFTQYNRMLGTYYHEEGDGRGGDKRGGMDVSAHSPMQQQHPGEMLKDPSDIELTFVGKCREADEKKQVCCDDDLEDSGPIVPSEPSDINWTPIFAPYAQGTPWNLRAKFTLIDPVADKDAMADLRKGQTLYSVMSVEATMRPIEIELIEFQQGRAKERPMWHPLHEARLRTSAIFISAAKAFTKRTEPNPGVSFLVKMFHVNWRFYLFVIIGVQNDSDKIGFGRPFLGYHYYAIDKKAAIIKKCF